MPGGAKRGIDRLVGLDAKGQVDAGDLVIRAAERFDDQEVRIVRRKDDPVAAAQRDQLAGLEESGHRTFLKMSGRAATFSARLSL